MTTRLFILTFTVLTFHLVAADLDLLKKAVPAEILDRAPASIDDILGEGTEVIDFTKKKAASSGPKSAFRRDAPSPTASLAKRVTESVAVASLDDSNLIRIEFRSAGIDELLKLYQTLTKCVILGRARLEQSVTLVAPEPVSRERAINLITAALAFHGISLEDDKQKGMVVVRQRGEGMAVIRSYDTKYRSAEILAEALRGSFSSIFGSSTTPPKVTLCGQQLLITAPESLHKEITALLAQLDKRSRQVHIEAKFIEVTLDKDTRLGVEWEYYANDAKSTVNDAGTVTNRNFHSLGTTDFSSGNLMPNLTDTNFTAGSIPTVEGMKLAMLSPYNAFQLKTLITAYSQDQKIKVLSTPSLVTMEGCEAELLAGERVPYLSAVSYNGTATPTNEYTQYDVGINLKIKPKITEDGDVILDISHSFDDVLATNSSGQQTFGQRKSRTRVVVKDGHSLVMSGLMRDNMKTTITGLPFLKDLPLLGTAFRKTTETPVKTELILLVTPTVIKSSEAGDDVTRREQEKMPKVLEHSGVDFFL